jgi:molybdopterin synthase sulfur carrier subunit
VLLWIAAIITIYTGYDYFRAGLKTCGGRMSVRIVYFAWVRERIGKGSEEIELPDTVITVGDLIAHLATLGEEYAAAFEVPQVIRAAINEEHAEHDEAIGDAREIALFPPMTGG